MSNAGGAPQNHANDFSFSSVVDSSLDSSSNTLHMDFANL